jgi:predicted aspartyl protease
MRVVEKREWSGMRLTPLAPTNSDVHLLNICKSVKGALFVVGVEIHAKTGRYLVDYGATHNFSNTNFLFKHNLLPRQEWDTFAKIKVKLADGTYYMASKNTIIWDVKIGTAIRKVDTHLINLSKEYALILGMDWLEEQGAIMDFENR